MLKFTMGKVLKRHSMAESMAKSSQTSLQRCKTSLNNLAEKIQQYQSLNKDPEHFIKNSLKVLREQLNYDKAISIQLVNEHYTELNERLDHIEADCIEQCKVNNQEGVEAEIEENYVNMKKNLDILVVEDVTKQDLIVSSCNRYFLELEKMIDDLKSELFLNKTIHYKQNIDGLKYSLESVELIEEPAKRNLENITEFGKFDFTKNQFKTFMETKGSKFKSPHFMFNDMKWSAILKNEDGENMSFFVQCIRGDQSREVSSHLFFQLKNKLDSTKHEYGEIVHKFMVDEAKGFPWFITFKKIMNGGFYDEDTDSVSLTVSIRITSIKI